MARTKQPKKPSPAPGYQPPAIDHNRLYQLYDAVLEGSVVTASSIEEFGALLALFQKNGYEMKPRTEWEKKDNQWLFIVRRVDGDSTPKSV